MKKEILIAIIFSCLTFSCKKEKTDTIQVNDEIAVDEVLGKGNFSGYQHDLSGKARLVRDTSGNVVVRLEMFSMTQGPDVYVYLSKNATYSEGNVIQLQRLTTGYESSNVTVEVGDNLDFTQYPYILVYCYQYSALFGTAYLE